MPDSASSEPLPKAVRIPADDVFLDGDLALPHGADGLVIFAHGSGSSRYSPRNRNVARHFNRHFLATVLLDLLTGDEERIDEITRQLRFDIPMLARRVAATVAWALEQPATRNLPIGLFGASTGAAAALLAAAESGTRVAAVVSRGGRPDLAGPALASVSAPTLLIVGSRDHEVLELNRQALARLPGEARLMTVSGATHLFEEPGTLDEVARLATSWFHRHLPRSTGAP